MTKHRGLNGAKCFLYCASIILLALWAATFGVKSAYAAEPEAATIEEGVYVIQTQVSDKVLDISGGSTANGANVQTYQANGTAAQYWRIEKQGEHYAIFNSLSGMALDVAAAGKTAGTNVQIYAANGTLAQLWDFYVTENGGYEIRSTGNGLALDVSGASKSNGANVQVYTSNKSDAQIWTLDALEQVVEEGTYVVASAANANTVLDVASGSLSDGAAVQAWSSNNTMAQKWNVSYDGDTGFYTITSVNSCKSLDIPGANTARGVALQQYTANASKAQTWRIVQNDDDTFTFASVLNGMVLDLAAGSTANGTRMQTWDSNGTNAQKWTLVPANLTLADGVYHIESMLDTQSILDVNAGSTDELAKLQVWSDNDTFAQKWLIETSATGTISLKSVNSGLYLADNGARMISALSNEFDDAQWIARFGGLGGIVFENASTGKVIDLSAANIAAGTAVSTYAANGTMAQSWRLSAVNLVNDGCYRLGNREKVSQVLDVSAASLDLGARVQVYDWNGTNAQKWFVESVQNGWYMLTNVNSGLALDVKAGQAVSGTAVQQYEANYTNAQLWKFSVADNGGVELTSKLGNLDLTVRGDQVARGCDAIIASPLSNASFGWVLSPTEAVISSDVADVWGDPAYVERMRQKANSIGSSTDWFCTVDTSYHRVVVFERSGGKWVSVKTIDDIRLSGNTFTGNFYVTHKARGYWKEPDCYNVNDWWVCFIAAWSDDYNGHLRYDASVGQYDDGQGFHYGFSSGGCTAIPNYESAKWIYDNVGVGSSVTVF